MKATIIGGGIAGLTTAIALQKTGHQVTVFEAAPEMKPVGAALTLAANAMKALRKIGIAEQIIPHGQLLPFFRITDRKGVTISAIDGKALNSKLGPDNFSIRRASLQQALLDQLPAGAVHFNKRAASLEQAGKLANVHFTDGTVVESDLLIVADGIHSVLRQQLVPHARTRYAGYTCWRGMAEDPGFHVDYPVEAWDAKGRFGFVPLGEKEVYWYACINVPANDVVAGKYSIEEITRHFRRFFHPVPELIAATRPERLMQNDIYDLAPLSAYVYNRAILIGDAAHATTPNLGQGACQAIEDALVLAEELNKSIPVDQALQAFEQRRLARTHYITKQSRRIGKIAHISNPLLASLRDAAMRMAPASMKEKQFSKIYEVDF